MLQKVPEYPSLHVHVALNPSGVGTQVPCPQLMKLHNVNLDSQLVPKNCEKQLHVYELRSFELQIAPF